MSRIAVTGLVFVALVLTGHAQAKPNFAGSWEQVAPADNAGSRMLITHDATTLMEQHAAEGDDHVLKFILDGAEHADEPLAVGSGHEMIGRYKAAWTGTTLTIDQVTDYQSGFHREARQVWSLDAQGQLRIDLASNLPDGTNMKLTLVFKKATISRS